MTKDWAKILQEAEQRRAEAQMQLDAALSKLSENEQSEIKTAIEEMKQSNAVDLVKIVELAKRICQ